MKIKEFSWSPCVKISCHKVAISDTITSVQGSEGNVISEVHDLFSKIHDILGKTVSKQVQNVPCTICRVHGKATARQPNIYARLYNLLHASEQCI